MPEKPAFEFSAERPIVSRQDDLLGRTTFAEQMAAAIRGWRGQDSLVIALYGDWGTGKSSLKNMVVESLGADQQASPYVVEFNPWQWAGQDQLSQAFFREIAKVLGRKNASEEAKASAKRWKKYGAILGLTVEAFAATRRIGLALAAIGTLGLLGTLLGNAALRIISSVVVLLSLVALAILKSGLQFAKAIATYFSSIAAAEDKTLDEVKSELSGSLRDLKRPMLVVIDDVDRLTGPEMRLLFQLIKANADFPNMVYLALFQREVVESILTRELSTDGRQYLQKIVQVGFDIPRLQQSLLERVLFSRLDALLRGEAINKLWDKERWPNIFVPGLRPYFNTLRDVYRFLNTLSFQMAIFSKKVAFEVNPLDLISLEVLRVFEPEVFKALPASKMVLTNLSDRALLGAGAEAAQKSEVQAIVNRAPEQKRKPVEEILKEVFPPASWVFGGPRYSQEYSDVWFREHRACHPDLFDKYFYMAIPEGDLSQEELEKIVSLAGDRHALVTELRSLGERKLLDVAMDRLESYKDTIGLEHAVPFVTALLDVGDELPVGRFGISEIPPDMHTARIVYWYLKREPSVHGREDILKKSINDTTGIYMPAFVVALEGDKARENREEQSRLADDTGVKHLQELCLSKIRQAATDGILARHSRFAELLGFWKAWSPPGEIQAWVRTLVESRDGLLSFLVACMRETKSYGLGTYSVRSRWRVDLQAMEGFIAPELIEGKLAELPLGDLDEKQKTAVEVFRDAMKRKREGKPTFSPLDDM